MRASRGIFGVVRVLTVACLPYLRTYQDKRIAKVASLTDAADALLLEAMQTKGPAFAMSAPLWTTWSLGRFGTPSHFHSP